MSPRRSDVRRAPKVAVLLGSDSDLPVMRKCLAELDRLQVAYDVAVASAHRTPARVAEIVPRWEKEGVLVFVCAAGGAAHLAGAVAAHTTLPVLGVPMALPPFQGFDALLATAQMPPGVPVGTLGAGEYGAANAGLLAAEIVSLTDPALRERLRRDRDALRARVLEKDARVRQELGLLRVPRHPPEGA